MEIDTQYTSITTGITVQIDDTNGRQSIIWGSSPRDEITCGIYHCVHPRYYDLSQHNALEVALIGRPPDLG